MADKIRDSCLRRSVLAASFIWLPALCQRPIGGVGEGVPASIGEFAKMTMRKLAGVVVASVAVSSGASAQLGDMSGGLIDYTTGNSWTGVFNVFTGGPTFDFLAVRISPGSQGVASFQIPAFEDFADGNQTVLITGDWNHFGSTPFLAAASGTSRSDLAWELFFDQDISQPFDMDIALFSGSSQIASFVFPWDGGGGFVSFQQGSWFPDRSEIETAVTPVIPLPTAASMGLAGLGCLVVRRRRDAA